MEGELAMQRTLCEEMKKNQLEMDEFVQELDEDVEGMQVRSPLDSLSAGEVGSHLTTPFKTLFFHRARYTYCSSN